MVSLKSCIGEFHEGESELRMTDCGGLLRSSLAMPLCEMNTIADMTR